MNVKHIAKHCVVFVTHSFFAKKVFLAHAMRKNTSCVDICFLCVHKIKINIHLKALQSNLERDFFTF